MITYIVMWGFKDNAAGATKAKNLAEAKVLPETLKFEVAITQPGLECTYDLVMNTQFSDAQALSAYQNHPHHVAIKPFMKAVVYERQCITQCALQPALIHSVVGLALLRSLLTLV